MRTILLSLLALSLPAAALAQDYTDEASQGTYSQYSSDDSRVQQVDEGVQAASEQQLFDAFWNELGPYGRWDEDAQYGWVWYPTSAVDFQPYVNGEWAFTTEGWMFTSDDPFAWAVYHYGSWEYLDGGWAWIPGYEWAPAWVSFRSNGEFVGWAPLGPGGLVYGFNPWVRYGFSPWVFMPAIQFGHQRASTSIVPTGTAQLAFGSSKPVGGVSHGRCSGIPGTHPAAPAPIASATSAAGSTGATHAAEPINVYRPQPGNNNAGGGRGGGFAYHSGARPPSMHPGGRPGTAPAYQGPPSAPHGPGQALSSHHSQALQGAGPVGGPQGAHPQAAHPSGASSSSSGGKDSHH